MHYDFGKFIDESKAKCKTKADFIDKIKKEKKLIDEFQDSQTHLKRDLYVKRLNDASFLLKKE